jgi:hypothetical protein
MAIEIRQSFKRAYSLQLAADSEHLLNSTNVLFIKCRGFHFTNAILIQAEGPF